MRHPPHLPHVLQACAGSTARCASPPRGASDNVSGPSLISDFGATPPRTESGCVIVCAPSTTEEVELV